MQNRHQSEERERRIAECVDWLGEGIGRADMLKRCQVAFQCSVQSAHRYVSAAQETAARSDHCRTEHHRAWAVKVLKRDMETLDTIVGSTMSADPADYPNAIKALGQKAGNVSKIATLLHLDRVGPQFGLEATAVRQTILDTVRDAVQSGQLHPAEVDALRVALASVEDEDGQPMTLPDTWTQ